MVSGDAQKLWEGYWAYLLVLGDNLPSGEARIYI